jgi:hypothetical protein
VDYAAAGDRVVEVIDRTNCLLYELWAFDYTDPKSPKAGQGVVFDMLAGDHQRPYFNTSASVSGMPLLPGLIRKEELDSGVINHPIAMTLGNYPPGGNSWCTHTFTDMATHHQYCRGTFGGSFRSNQLPFGAKLRLKASFDASSFPSQAQVVVAALKKYGAINVDGGNAGDIEGTTNTSYSQPSTAYMYSNFGITASDWEVPTTGTVYCDPVYPCGAQPPTGALPTIGKFTATSSVGPGAPVTLAWTGITNVTTRLRFVSPEAGPVVTNSTVVTPASTTTYTLMVENAFGRATRRVTVKVPTVASGRLP